MFVAKRKYRVVEKTPLEFRIIVIILSFIEKRLIFDQSEVK